MMEIKSLDQWRSLAALLHKHGYRLWQMQYSFQDPEGFHAWFSKSGRPDVEIVTRDPDVQRAIVRFNGTGQKQKPEDI